MVTLYYKRKEEAQVSWEEVYCFVHEIKYASIYAKYERFMIGLVQLKEDEDDGFSW